MMNLLTRAGALGLAILIASPFCCCVAAPAQAEPPVHSCCQTSSSEDERAPAEPCPGCQSKIPRAADGGKTVLVTVEWFELPDVMGDHGVWDFHRPVPGDSLPAVSVPESPPPRLLLVLQQRFLI